MATLIIGKEALTSVRLANGSRVNVTAGAVVPGHADEADVERLLEEGYLEQVEYASDDEPVGPDVDPDSPEVILKGTVTAILDQVGDNADLAAALLEVETGEGGKNRPTLVKGLQEAVDAAAGSGD